MNSISHSQKERLLCNLTYLFCFCEANTPFPRDSMSKAFILCTLWLGTVLVCGRVCIHILVYLVVSLAHSRIIMDFTHQSVIVLWKHNFMWFFFKVDKSILQVQDVTNFSTFFFFRSASTWTFWLSLNLTSEILIVVTNQVTREFPSVICICLLYFIWNMSWGRCLAGAF